MIALRRSIVSSAQVVATGLAVRGHQCVWHHSKWRVTALEGVLHKRWCSVPKNASDGIIDVQGGKIGEDKPEEGKLFIAERAKNLVSAHRRFQLSSYNRLPDGRDDMTCIHSDPNEPVNAYIYTEDCNFVVHLNPDNPSHNHHMGNISRLANSALSVGHLDPPPLIPVFTRVGLLPPYVRLVGNLVSVSDAQEQVMRSELADLGHKIEGGKLLLFETGTVQFVDLFNKALPVSMRDFRAAFTDKLAKDQMQLIYMANTKFLEDLPRFVKAFLGVPIDDGYMYTADRAGFSVFGYRKETQKWREYRFPFAREVVGLEDFESMLMTMVHECKTAEEADAAASKKADLQ